MKHSMICLQKNCLRFYQYTSIAEALQDFKNSNPNSATNVVFYIGDPALKLAIPQNLKLD
jgi:hypothetical protein